MEHDNEKLFALKFNDTIQVVFVLSFENNPYSSLLMLSMDVGDEKTLFE